MNVLFYPVYRDLSGGIFIEFIYPPVLPRVAANPDLLIGGWRDLFGETDWDRYY